MPIHFDNETKKWILSLTTEENMNIKLLHSYLSAKINTTCTFVDRNSKINQLEDLRLYNDEDFFNS